PWSTNNRAVPMKMPAAVPMTTPLIRRFIFCWTSALASSISSRMIVVARSEISCTAAAMVGPWGCPLSAAKASQDSGDGHAAHEGGADEQFGTTAASRGRRGDARGRGLGQLVADGLGRRGHGLGLRRRGLGRRLWLGDHG